MLTLDEHFRSYASYHRTRGNQVCHYFGIPMITVSVFGLLGLLGHGFLNAGIALWAGTVLWFLTLDWRLGVPFGLFSLGLYFAGQAMTPALSVGLFVLGWVFQLVGHSVFEKNRPAFLDNLRQLLIGPLWVFAKALGRS